MKKNVFGRKFKRDKNERRALLKGLLSNLIINERIETTREKAKAVKGLAEKLVSRAGKKGDRGNNAFSRYLTNKARKRLIENIAPRFLNVSGGYTRIIKTGRRLADNAGLAIIEFTKKEEIGPDKAPKKIQEAPKEKPVASLTEEKKTPGKRSKNKSRKEKINEAK
ncbi:50S ribosomal protein L17 [Patescibacteria group bacterium]|nr:50S ribosomal protein L17 [Patescibacteria group bacterium]